MDHPHHSTLKDAGAPTPTVNEQLLRPPPGHTIVIDTLNMQYYVTYSHGPPCLFRQPHPILHHPPFYPSQPPPCNGYPGPWYPPGSPVFCYCHAPILTDLPAPHFVGMTLQALQMQPIKPERGALTQIRNPGQRFQRYTRPKPASVQEQKRFNKPFPPDIHDITIFPSLTSKVEYLGPFLPAMVPQLGWAKKPSPGYDEMLHHDRIGKQQNNNKVMNNKNVEIFKKFSGTKFPQSTAQAVPGPTSATVMYKNKLDLLPGKSPQAQEVSPWLIPRDPNHKAPTNVRQMSLKDQELYNVLLRYIPSMKRLEDYGYPLVHTRKPMCAVILKNDFNYTTFSDNNGCKQGRIKNPKRLCDRCGKIFIMKTGKEVQRDTCVYHWGKTQTADNFKVYLTCCKQPLTSEGCMTAKSHVWNGLKYGVNANLKGFVCTGLSTFSTRTKIFGLDCEMCFTTAGFELVKVALVDIAGNQVYYSLVIPENEVLDYNTNFSGVSHTDYLTFKAKSFRNVQDDILKLVKSDTIVIGHGLENDLRALKIVHTLVVDTSVVYPHKSLYPYRRSLKDLAKEVLNREIQHGAHNPVEDASVCVQLVLRKLKEDLNIEIIPDAK